MFKAGVVANINKMKKKIKVIAFYLPQYHPFPENDEWWGKGFTEWTNVGKAKKLFPGHYQPHVPADLGYYDLRLPVVREQQAEMAMAYGLSAFCIYHYWFGGGKVLMERPLNDMLKLKSPDFPFLLCWANHSWENKNWNSDSQRMERKMLIEQKYLGLDDAEKQFYYLLDAFKDERYFKIKGRLAYVFYRADMIPYYKEMCVLWNKLAEENGLPGFYFISNVSDMSLLDHPANQYMESNCLCLMSEVWGGYSSLTNRVKEKLSKFIGVPTRVVSYKNAIEKMVSNLFSENRIIPVVVPNWDHSPRLGANGTIFHNSTPNLFEKLFSKTIDLVKEKSEDERIVFVKSWNEWAEGNHLEPDLKYGTRYLEAIKRGLLNFDK